MSPSSTPSLWSSSINWLLFILPSSFIEAANLIVSISSSDSPFLFLYGWYTAFPYFSVPVQKSADSSHQNGIVTQSLPYLCIICQLNLFKITIYLFKITIYYDDSFITFLPDILLTSEPSFHIIHVGMKFSLVFNQTACI